MLMFLVYFSDVQRIFVYAVCDIKNCRYVYALYNILAWEPSAAQVTHSYFYRLPALKRFYWETKFSPINVDPPNLESQNQTKNISVGLPSSPIKIWGKSVQGFLSYDRTNKKKQKKTDKQRLQLYIFR